MKVSELAGAQLDYWIFRSEGRIPADDQDEFGEPSFYWHDENGEIGGTEPLSGLGSPSTDWAQGGPIIDRERIATSPMNDGSWAARTPFPWYGHGETPLIAAMRAFVASVYGEEVPSQDAEKSAVTL